MLRALNLAGSIVELSTASVNGVSLLSKTIRFKSGSYTKS